MNTKFWVGLAAVAVVAAFGAAALSNKAADTSDLKIGVVLGLTGVESVWAEHNLNAAKLAVDEINAQGGVAGRKLVLVIEDSKSDPKTGISAFQKLTAVDGVSIVMGDVWSHATNPMIPVAQGKRVPLISPTVMDTSVEGDSAYFYTLGHTVESLRPSIERFFELNPDIKTVYELCWSDDWGAAHSALFADIAHKRGLTIVGKDCTADYTSDYRTEAAKIKRADPDAVFMVSSLSERAVKALNDLDVTAKVYNTSVIGQALRTGKTSVEQLDRVWFADWLPNEAFVSAYEKKYGMYPLAEAQNSYETIRAIAKAYEHDPNDWLSGLSRVKYEGVEGPIDFTLGSRIAVNHTTAKLYRVSPDGEFVEAK